MTAGRHSPEAQFAQDWSTLAKLHAQHLYAMHQASVRWRERRDVLRVRARRAIDSDIQHGVIAEPASEEEYENRVLARAYVLSRDDFFLTDATNTRRVNGELADAYATALGVADILERLAVVRDAGDNRFANGSGDVMSAMREVTERLPVRPT